MRVMTCTDKTRAPDGSIIAYELRDDRTGRKSVFNIEFLANAVREREVRVTNLDFDEETGQFFQPAQSGWEQTFIPGLNDRQPVPAQDKRQDGREEQDRKQSRPKVKRHRRTKSKRKR